jgi:hypothetical protein
MADPHARLSQKLGEFREMAASARQAAEKATTPRARLAHEEVARCWEQLIQEVEALIRGGL